MDAFLLRHFSLYIIFLHHIQFTSGFDMIITQVLRYNQYYGIMVNYQYSSIMVTIYYGINLINGILCWYSL
jgi:hypothetical protein